MIDRAINGKIAFSSGKVAFRDGSLIYLTPRGVRSTRTNRYAPFLGKGAMACCPDPTTPECKEIVEKKLACPVKRKRDPNCKKKDREKCPFIVDSILPAVDPDIKSQRESGCDGEKMCVKLSKPPEKLGEVVDLLSHSSTLPLPLSFINVGERRGSLVMYRRCSARGGGKDSTTNENGENEENGEEDGNDGFYFARCLRKEHPQSPLGRENKVVLARSCDGKVDIVDPLSCYVLEIDFADGEDGEGEDGEEDASFEIDGSFIELGFRVFDKTDSAPCLVVGVNGVAGRGGGVKIDKTKIKTLTLVTDLDEMRVRDVSSIRVDDAVSGLAKAAGSTAMRHCIEDAKLRYAYFNQISDVKKLDLKFMIHNAGGGQEWYRLMEAEADEDVPVSTVDAARNVTPLDMHTSLGISAEQYSSEEEQDKKLEKTKASMNTKLYQVEWRKDGDKLYLMAKQRSAAEYASNADKSILRQILNAAAAERDEAERKCKAAAANASLAMLLKPTAPTLSSDAENGRCKGDGGVPLHMHGVPIEKSALPTKAAILKSCAEQEDILSRHCVLAARASKKEDVDKELSSALASYCSKVGEANDDRCRDGAKASEFVNADAKDEVVFEDDDVADAGELWFLVIIVLLAVLYTSAGAIFATEKKGYAIGLAITFAAVASLRFAFPVEFHGITTRFGKKVLGN